MEKTPALLLVDAEKVLISSFLTLDPKRASSSSLNALILPLNTHHMTNSGTAVNTYHWTNIGMNVNP
jgi:hypothetical protein